MVISSRDYPMFFTNRRTTSLDIGLKRVQKSDLKISFFYIFLFFIFYFSYNKLFFTQQHSFGFYCLFK